MEKRKGTDKVDFADMAKGFLEGAGGFENITNCYNCITRLRLEIKDPAAVDEEKIKASGAVAVIWPDTNLIHIVLGPQVLDVSREMKKLMEIHKAVL